jgi:hypothetical protein
MLAPIVMPTNKAPEHAEPKIPTAIASFLQVLLPKYLYCKLQVIQAISSFYDKYQTARDGLHKFLDH